MIHVKPLKHFVPPKITFDKISKFNNFRFDSNEILAHEAYEIGVGKSIQYFNAYNRRNQQVIEVSKLYHAGNVALASATGDAYWLLLGEMFKKIEEHKQDDRIDEKGCFTFVMQY